MAPTLPDKLVSNQAAVIVEEGRTNVWSWRIFASISSAVCTSPPLAKPQISFWSHRPRCCTSRGPREVQHTQFARPMATKVLVATTWLPDGIGEYPHEHAFQPFPP